AELDDYLVRDDPAGETKDYRYEAVELETRAAGWPAGLSVIDAPPAAAGDYLPAGGLGGVGVDLPTGEAPAAWRLLDDAGAAGHDFVLFACTRSDDVRPRDWPRLRQHAAALLPAKTRFGPAGVFFVSGRKALDARLRGGEEAGEN